MVPGVEGNEAHINFGGLWLGEKNSVIGFREITKELGWGGGAKPKILNDYLYC